MMMQSSGGGNVERSRGGSSSLADVVALILDKGIVVDVFARVSLVGIEILSIDVRVVIASVDTYLRFAEAVNRLDLTENGGVGLPDLLEQGVEEAAETGARTVTKRKLGGAIESVKETVEDLVGSDDDDGRH
jgi:gas vesicle structural protein